jgi:hypothetical protein
VQTVSSVELAGSPEVNLVQALAGQTAGEGVKSRPCARVGSVMRWGLARSPISGMNVQN